MPGFLRIYFSSLLWLLCAALAVSVSPTLHAQGFGSSKKKVTLHRKLPPVARLGGTTIKVEVAAKGFQGDVATDLQRMLETELLKDDLRLRPTDKGADNLISCSIIDYALPPPTTSTQTNYLSGSKKPQNDTFTRYTGRLTVAYQAKDGHSGRVHDSANIAAKYDDEFGAMGSTHKGIGSAFSSQWDKLKHGKTAEDAPPTSADVRGRLLTDAVSQIASRLVNTQESIDVFLARGKLDDANKQADAGLWTRYRETLETMPPFPSKEDDAYRLYNIGVAYEALAYESEDPAAATKFLQEAAIHYGRAIDDKPSEKYFLEPQKRIDTAMAHYKRLHEDSATQVAADTDQGAKGQTAKSAAPRAGKTASASPSTSASHSTQKTASAKPPAAVGNSIVPASSKAVEPLTNDQVIQLVKANLDEENIIDTIKTAPAVNFDLSVNGEIKLAQNGVKGKILSAMKTRARQPGH
jgi:tetratricopeptide (TPR) repeat protein